MVVNLTLSNMNTENFNSRTDGFNVMDFRAYFSFKTPNSISFDIERYSSSLCPVRQLGWIDVHYPCAGHIKVQIRVCLPQEYHDESEKMRTIANAVLNNLALPEDETYELHAFVGSETKELAQPINREGFTDRLYSSS